MKKIYMIVLSVILIRIVYFCFALAVNPVVEPNFRTTADYEGFTGVFSKNDAGWYKDIAENGYRRIMDRDSIGFSHKDKFIQSSWAFFPAYPYLNKAIGKITSLEYPSAALISSILLSVFAFVGLFRFCTILLKDEKRAFFVTMLMLVLPFNYYFFVFYTEALFFTFLVYSFLAIYHKKNGLLVLLLIPLALTRPNGLIMTIPLFAYYLERNDLLHGYRLVLKGIFTRKVLLVVLFFSSSLVAFLLFGMYQKHMTDEFFAFSIAQRGWYREFMFPVLALFRKGDFATQFNSIYTIIVMLFAIIAWKRFMLSMNLLIWLSLIFPLCSGSVTSMQRYVSVIFPLTIFLAELIYRTRIRVPIIGLIFLLQLTVFYFWLSAEPFSY